MITIVGWDVGGANVKAAWLAADSGKVRAWKAVSHPYEIWRNKDLLPNVLQAALIELNCEPPQGMAVTMTAELADVFGTKREGVLFVLDSLMISFPGWASYALSLEGDFIPCAEAREHPLDFAAANWLATALFIARQYPNCILMDVGSTTTDIIPIQDGQVASQGRTDLERLISGELVYTGLLRTNLATIVSAVHVGGRICPVASEYFAISGDVHLILGHIQTTDLTCSTPDNRPPSLDSARRRLARLVCADMEMLAPEEIDQMAHEIYIQQLKQIERGLRQVLSRSPGLQVLPVVILGSGAFLAEDVARSQGLAVIDWKQQWGPSASVVAPSLAAAQLLAERMEGI